MDPDVIDRCVLELASQRGVGTEGRALGAILDVMRDRGFQVDDVYDALQILRENGEIDCPYTSRPERPWDDRNTVVRITAKGKERLRRLAATAQFNIRLPDEIRVDLGAWVGQLGDSESAVAVAALREWIRTQKFPGIDFRPSATGRKPYVTGTGLSVWELYRMWLDHGSDGEKIRRNYPDLKPAQIAIAVKYATTYLYEMPVDSFGKRPSFVPEVKV